MDEVYQRLADRRKFLTSRTDIASNLDDNSSSVMASFNSKVDLRLPWMVGNNDTPNGKPHVDAVLQPEQRNQGIPRSIPGLSPETLKNVTLRKTGIRDSIPAEENRIPFRNQILNPEKPIIRRNSDNIALSFQVDSWSNDGTNIPSPPPPPPPPPKSATFPRVMRDSTYQSEGVTAVNVVQAPSIDAVAKTQQILLDATIKQLEDKIKLMEVKFQQQPDNGRYHMSQSDSDVPPSYNDRSDTKSVDTIIGNRKVPSLNDMGMEKLFNNDLLDKKHMKNWIDTMVEERFERASRIDNAQPIDDDSRPPRGRQRSKSKDKNRNDSRSRGRSKSKDSHFDPRSYASRECSVDTTRSDTRSMKSVLFKRTEEDELLSEIDSDDVADIDTGDTTFIDYTSNKFTIHGPFVDKELNVFHAICTEYQLAAKISFAKRTRYARTNPAYVRVYALLGSNKRSKWTNRDSWNAVAHNLQVLDFLFRKIIRSESKKIRKPIMELEHFTEGRILDNERFKAIMLHAFRKRDHLINVLGVDVAPFYEIK